MNRKYILIVIVLAAIAEGGILAYQHYSALQGNQKTNDSFVPDETHLVTKAHALVADFMKARLEGNQPLAESFLTDNAKKQYSQPGLTLIGTSNPHFVNYALLGEQKIIWDGRYLCEVRIYEGLTGQPATGYFDEILTVIKVRNKYLIDSVQRTEYIPISK